jgi:hypothetical protein
LEDPDDVRRLRIGGEVDLLPVLPPEDGVTNPSSYQMQLVVGIAEPHPELLSDRRDGDEIGWGEALGHRRKDTLGPERSFG